ncbi:MAG: ExbD/TolR family protein [Kiritimatiellia bacterium]
MKHRRRNVEGCELDMTPMIDVVFQMIIFFIVTIKMDENINEEIRLEEAKDGPLFEGEDPRMLVVEVNRQGWLSINNVSLNKPQLRNIIMRRYGRFGTFPVMIRADRRTEHRHVREVMDICTEIGIWQIDFAAVKIRKK